MPRPASSSSPGNDYSRRKVTRASAAADPFELQGLLTTLSARDSPPAAGWAAAIVAAIAAAVVGKAARRSGDQGAAAQACELAVRLSRLAALDADVFADALEALRHATERTDQEDLRAPPSRETFSTRPHARRGSGGAALAIAGGGSRRRAARERGRPEPRSRSSARMRRPRRCWRPGAALRCRAPRRDQPRLAPGHPGAGTCCGNRGDSSSRRRRRRRELMLDEDLPRLVSAAQRRRPDRAREPVARRRSTGTGRSPAPQAAA